MFRIVTVASECGSGGAAIAENVAGRLGWRLLDRDLVKAVARYARVDPELALRYDERVDSWWHRFNNGGFWSAAIMAGASPADLQIFDARAMAVLTRDVIYKAAEDGFCVIVGRGAQCVLEGEPRALHVFVHAPLSERVTRVRRKMRTAEDVERAVRWTDASRANYIRTYFGCDWKDPDLYHLMLSSQIGDHNAARVIVNAVESRPQVAFSRAIRL